MYFSVLWEQVNYIMQLAPIGVQVCWFVHLLAAKGGQTMLVLSIVEVQLPLHKLYPIILLIRAALS